MTQNGHNFIIIDIEVALLRRKVKSKDNTRYKGYQDVGEQCRKLKIMVHVDLTESDDSVRLHALFYIQILISIRITTPARDVKE